VIVSISSDSFLDCLPRGGRILPRRILIQGAVAARVGVKEERMSRKNGDRSRFDRQRKAKIHNRTRIRGLWTTIRAQKTAPAQNADQPGKTRGSPETTQKA
jgi:hypothetical protein